MEYTVHKNQHGIPFRAGPRPAGPHVVFDVWDVGPATTRIPGPCVVRCERCAAEWPEGGEYPQECKP